MSDSQHKHNRPSTSSNVVKPETAGHLHEPAIVDEDKQRKSGEEAQGVLDKSNVETGSEESKMTGHSLVYTATKDTLFTNQKSPARNHILSPEWVFGRNPSIPVTLLQDHDQMVVLYTSAHFGVVYNQTLNIQHILQGHSHPISCMCVSEDGRWIATTDRGSQSMLMIWDSYSGVPVKTLFDCHVPGGVTAMAFSSNAEHLVTVGSEKVQRLCIWDWTSDAQEPFCCTELNPEHGFQDYIIFKPTDSTQLLSGSRSHVLFHTRAKGNLQYTALKPKKSVVADIRAAAAVPTQPSPEAAIFLCQSVFHWRMPQILTPILGSIVVWANKEDSVENKRLPTKIVQILHLLRHTITVLKVTDCFFVTGDAQGQISFYDENFRILTMFTDNNMDGIVSISLSKESTEGYLEGSSLETKPLIIRNLIVSTVSSKVLHVNTQSGIVQTLSLQHCDPLYAVACHPSQPVVAIGSQDGFLKVWDYNSKVIIGSRAFESDRNIQCITFDPNGLYLAVGFGSGTVHILNSHTLQSDPEEGFHCISDCIHLITFSSDSQYLATADAGNAVTLFQFQKYEDSLPQWIHLGRSRSHYKPIKDLLFGVHPDSTQPRLLSLGMDRRLVEYDLKKSAVNHLIILSSERIEQRAIPLCMTWYPPLTTEQFLLISSDQYKIKLFNSTTNMCRKTLLGPTYGSPIKQVAVLPKSTELEMNSHHLAYITEDKVGLQILPLDGNPYKSSALMCHPTGVSALACSYDGRFVFTVGEFDCCVLSWEINLKVLEAAAALGGKDMVPFYTLLDGGRDGKFYRNMEDFFYHCQILRYGSDLMEQGHLSNTISLSAVSSLMRALGYFPTEKEIEDMENEVKFSKYSETGKHATKINLEDFIKLYINHRPAFDNSIDELAQAFHILGRGASTGQPVLLKHELLELLQVQGEHITEEAVKQCFAGLLGFDEDSEEEEGLCGADRRSEFSLESAIPDEVSMETFLHSFLGFKSSVEQSDRPSSPKQ